MKRKIILIVFVVLIGLYLIWFMFKSEDVEEPKDFIQEVEEIEQKEKPIPKEEGEKDVTDNEKGYSEKKNETQENNSLEEKFSHIQVPDEVPTKDDFFGVDTVKETMEQASQFVKVFHSYDHASPKNHIHGIRNLVYEEIFDFFIDTELNYIEGIYDVRGIKLRVPKEIIIVEDDLPFPDENIYWNVEVKSEVTKNDGTKEVERKNYNLEFERNSLGKYRIVDFFVYD